MLQTAATDDRREASDQDFAALRQAADARFTEFWTSLVWQPIADYYRPAAASVVLRGAGDTWAFGYWGASDDRPDVPTWLHLQDHLMDLPVDFEPVAFATVNAEWAEALMQD